MKIKIMRRAGAAAASRTSSSTRAWRGLSSASSPPPPPPAAVLESGAFMDSLMMGAPYSAPHAPPSWSRADPVAAAEAASTADERLDGGCDALEWALRVELAAAYRLVDMMGWTDTINNHLTMRLPTRSSDGAEQFLINCYGMGFDEVTASSLVKIDGDGAVLGQGAATGCVNKAGYVIHAAIHAAREDAHCVMHTHEVYTTAVSALECGLLPITQTAMVLGPICYHDYEGVAVHPEERASLTEDVTAQPQAGVMMLKNHGVLTLGRSIPQAFTRLFFTHKACKMQVMAMSAAGGEEKLQRPREEVEDLVTKEQSFTVHPDEAKEDFFNTYCAALFNQHVRQLRRTNPGFDV